MNNSGIFSLGDFTLEDAATQTGEVVTDLEGLSSVSVQGRLLVGDSDSSAETRLHVQTSLDQGATWFDVAVLAFSDFNQTKALTVAAEITGDGAIDLTEELADDQIRGILGDRLRARVVSLGEYLANTLLSVRVAVR